MTNCSKPKILPKFFRVNFKIFWIFSFLFIIILFGLQISQINVLTKEIYSVKNSKEKISLLEKENKILEISSSQTNSLGKIEEKLKELGFERVGKAKYLRILEGSVVTVTK